MFVNKVQIFADLLFKLFFLNKESRYEILFWKLGGKEYLSEGRKNVILKKKDKSELIINH